MENIRSSKQIAIRSPSNPRNFRRRGHQNTGQSSSKKKLRPLSRVFSEARIDSGTKNTDSNPYFMKLNSSRKKNNFKSPSAYNVRNSQKLESSQLANGENLLEKFNNFLASSGKKPPLNPSNAGKPPLQHSNVRQRQRNNFFKPQRSQQSPLQQRRFQSSKRQNIQENNQNTDNLNQSLEWQGYLASQAKQNPKKLDQSTEYFSSRANNQRSSRRQNSVSNFNNIRSSHNYSNSRSRVVNQLNNSNFMAKDLTSSQISNQNHNNSSQLKTNLGNKLNLNNSLLRMSQRNNSSVLSTRLSRKNLKLSNPRKRPHGARPPLLPSHGSNRSHHRNLNHGRNQSSIDLNGSNFLAQQSKPSNNRMLSSRMSQNFAQQGLRNEGNMVQNMSMLKNKLKSMNGVWGGGALR